MPFVNCCRPRKWNTMNEPDQNPCELLTWDSEFFGFPIGRVRGDQLTPDKAEKIESWAIKNKIHCLYFLSRSDDSLTTGLAEKNGFGLVDIRMSYEWKNSKKVAWLKPVSLRSAKIEDENILSDIAGKIHYQTRYFYDNRFPHHLCESLYRIWIKKSVEGYADVVLVAVDKEDVPVGYISCHVDHNPLKGRIGLAGVSPGHLGLGIGQGLVLGALDWFLSLGIPVVTVVTQGRNYAAQRLYQKCGFLTRSVHLWYHKWYALIPNTV